MDFTNGADRILFIKIAGNWLPVGCLTDNSFEENAEMMDTTTRDNGGWATSRPVMQSYGIGFNGLQLNTTVAGGNFGVVSYDMLKQLKRGKTLIEWKIEGTVWPIIDYGKGFISSIGEANAIDELMSFSGQIVGFGEPLSTQKGTTVLNSGSNINEVINTGNVNEIIKTKDI